VKKFIIGIREHPIFGYTAVPLIVGNCNDEYCKIIRSVVFQDVIDTPKEYTELQKEIVSIIDNYSDDKIYAYYNRAKKKRSITDFLASLDKDTINKMIRPFIEKHIFHLFKVLENTDIEIFYKPHRYEYIYFTDKITISPVPAKAIFNFERTGEGIKYHLSISFKGRDIPIYQKKPIILLNNPGLIELEHILMYLEDINANKLLPFYSNEFVNVRKEMELTYFKNFILKTVRDYDVKAKGFEILNLNPKKKAQLWIENDWLGEYAIIPKFDYNGKVFKSGDELNNFVDFNEEDFSITKFSRDKEWEQKHIDFLLKTNLIQKDKNIFKADYSGKDKNKQHDFSINWLNQNHKIIQDFGFEIVQRFSSKKYYVKEISLEFEVENKIDWFDINAIVKIGDFEIPFYKFRNNILDNKPEYELPNGEIVIIPETWFKKYKNVLKFAKKSKNNHFQLSKLHYFALQDTQDDKLEIIDTGELNKFFANPNKNSIKIPYNLETKLRDYQQIGYSWLNHLKKNNFGGCLADDMGLGKTIQILSAILKSLEEAGQISKSGKYIKNKNHLLNLVIVPRSLLHNWLNEVKKNTPSIRAIIYAGNDREKIKKTFNEHDLIITSYGIARNDLDFFTKFIFNYIVLDESQYIKNPNSKTYQAIKQLNAQNKVVLTGTPIENSLKDLWTQMNFVNDGIFGTFSFFRKNYIAPIEKNQNDDVKNELKRLIAPFIIRRTKEEVIKDLPDIEEQNIVCEMTEEQQAFYDEEKSKIRNKIIEFHQKGTLKQSSIYILQALTKLRQIANHPLMLKNDNPSGKFDEIMSRLETLKERNHKVLIFSNFVKFLKLFEAEFEKRKWKYLMLTGETTKRQKMIDEFQEDDDTRLFLLSIKAGGVGVNLTAADYVFVLDPWWNPAIEKQAIARAHRIGQTKNVFAFKFITFGTIEEKIQILQKKKLKLANEFIDSNNYFKYFSEDAIVELFN